MATHARLVFAVMAAAVVCAGRPSRVSTQAVASGTARSSVSHIGIVVDDLARSLQALASVLDVPVPPIQADIGIGGPTRARGAQFHLTNLSIDLLDAQSAVSYGDHLTKAAPGVHHLGFERHDLEPQATTYTMAELGASSLGDGSNVFLDLQSRIGLTLELASLGTREFLYGFKGARPFLGTAPLTQLPCVTHIGVVVRDLEQARGRYAEVFGVTPTPVREFRTPATGAARVTMLNLRNVSIELIQQVRRGMGRASGAYATFLGRAEHRVHHIGLHLRGADGPIDVPAQIAWLERHGGKVAVDGGGGFAYVDYRSTIGLFVEALAESSNRLVYPHPHLY